MKIKLAKAIVEVVQCRKLNVLAEVNISCQLYPYETNVYNSLSLLLKTILHLMLIYLFLKSLSSEL